MGWLIAVIIIALAVFSPAFRTLLLCLAALAAIAGGIIYFWQQSQDAAAKRRVPDSDVVFENLRMGKSQYGDSYRLNGRLRNNNKRYTVTQIVLRITLKDCPIESDPAKTDQACDIVGETDNTLFLDVPPGQVRDIDDGVYFSSGSNVHRQMRWHYGISSISAESR